MSNYREVPPESIPEVAEYLDAVNTLETFLGNHPGFKQAVGSLLEVIRQKKQAAEKVVKARQVFCGPWKKHNEKVEYDADALYDLLGREQFMRVGGSETTITKREVDKKKIEMAIARQEIPAKTLEKVREEKVSYKSVPDFKW